VSSEKTEQPTPKKLRDARQKGQVAVSRDITSTVTLALAMIYLAVGLPAIMERLGALIVRSTNMVDLDFQTSATTVVREAFICSAYILLPFLAVIIFGGVFSIYAQIGFLLAPDAIKPDLKRLNPVDKAKQIFSIKNLIEFVKNVIKILFLSILIYLVLKQMIPELILAPTAGPASMLTVLGLTMKTLAINIVVGYLIIASADFFFQQWQHRRQLMMTKDEVKQEYKEMEGDPIIKSKRRQLHEEIVLGDDERQVAGSTAVVTNPLHIAVAIRYEKGETDLPVVTAMGRGVGAERIRDIATRAAVPIAENLPLARDLHHQCRVGQAGPGNLLAAVAEVIVWARQVRDQTPPPTDIADTPDDYEPPYSHVA